MRDLFYKFEKPHWDNKFGQVKFSSISKQKLSYLFKYQPDIYKKVYDKFYKYIQKYDDYNEYFQNAKNETSKKIKSYIQGKKILSYGCGTAFIEEVNFPDEDITLMDSYKINKFGKRDIHGEEILDVWKGNCLLAIQLVPHMNKTELRRFFQLSFRLLEDGGLIIITHKPKLNIVKDIWDITKNLLKIILYKNETFILWSWRRSDFFYEKLANKNGFKLLSIEKNKYNDENIMILKKIPQKSI